MLIFTAWALSWHGSAFGAAAENGNTPGHGVKAPAQTRAKGAANGGARWSADPDRGWVRERDKRQPKPSDTTKHGDGTDKGKTKGKKS